MTNIGPGARLSAASLRRQLPYRRGAITPGIVHLGLGAFCRAHLAVYVHGLLGADPSWGIIGASLRHPDTRKALVPQDCLYTLATRSRSGTSTQVIGSILDVLDAATHRDELIATMIDPRIRIVSLTVTEKGYCHDPATRALDIRHPDIVHDLTHPEAPVSAPGLLMRALELRRTAGIPPFTVLCGDNLPANGETTKHVVSGFAALRSGALADYVEREVAFPSTMVDRIVPATTDEDREFIHERTGLWDAWPIVTEPFTQWVIEDRFPSGRPAFEAVGAQLVADVRPFELMKLRMLNGSHSTVAYLGYLSGYEFVDEAVADPAFHALLHELMTEEAMKTLPSGVGDLAAYRDALLDRFLNPALKHRTWQIAMDGSQKLPQRLLGTIRDCLARGLPIALATLGVAGWMRYVAGIDEGGREIDVRDPLAARLRGIARLSGGAPPKLVDGLLGVSEIFGDDLPRSELFRRVLTRHLTSLIDKGALSTVRSIVAAPIA